MGPVLCLVSDRRRTGSEDALVALVAAAARAGVHLVQVRERDLDGGPLFRLVQRCLGAVDGTAARIVVNERVDVATAAGAHGVHLRSESLPPERVRAMVPRGFLIGRSVHDEDEARRAADGGADYLLFGTVFESRSKPGTIPAGVHALTRIAAMTAVPVLAVGGVTPERAAEVARAGACGVAAIGMFADLDPPRLPAMIDRLTRAFDTVASAPRQ